MDARAGHGFQPASAGDSRSPCPALNAAANHGYLPHSGKNIGIWQLSQALHELYALSYPLAVFLSLGGILVCGRWGKLDLDQLSKHNRIEHDASLVHVDYSEGDYTRVSPPLVEELVADSTDGKGLTMNDFAKARARRELRPTVKIDSLHTRIARGESALSVLVMGHGQAMPLDAARTWFGEERLPGGWEPRGKLGLLQFAGINRSFDNMVEQVKVKLSEKRTE